VLRTEPRWVLLPENHPLADQESIDFADLLDEPFIALPTAAGAVRDFWLGNDARNGRHPKIGAEAATPEDKLEAVSSVSAFACSPRIMCRCTAGQV